MANWKRLGLALVAVAALSGCGRSASNLAIPAQQSVAFEATGASAPTATVELTDLGSALQVHLTGTGFATAGAYSVVPLTAYQSATSYRRTLEDLPQALPVVGDGAVDLLSTFSYFGPARPWVAIGVFYNADGDASNTRAAQLVAVAMLPEDLSR